MVNVPFTLHEGCENYVQENQTDISDARLRSLALCPTLVSGPPTISVPLRMRTLCRWLLLVVSFRECFSVLLCNGDGYADLCGLCMWRLLAAPSIIAARGVDCGQHVHTLCFSLDLVQEPRNIRLSFVGSVQAGE